MKSILYLYCKFYKYYLFFQHIHANNRNDDQSQINRGIFPNTCTFLKYSYVDQKCNKKTFLHKKSPVLCTKESIYVFLKIKFSKEVYT